MPEEIVIVILAAIGGGTFMIISIVKMVLNYLSNKHQSAQEGSGSSSLTKGELHTLIQDAVAGATTPLSERVADLEQQLQTAQLPPARPDLLEGAEGYLTETAPSPSERRAVR